MSLEEVESTVQELVDEIRSDDDERIELAKQQLMKLAQSAGLHTVYNMLESIKRSEVLVVQWEIQDILEELIPPDSPKEEEEDDPTKRPLRESEMQMVAQVPQQGLVLFKSKVDTRWVLMQIDPYTGQLMGKQELENDRGEEIYKQMNQAPSM
jgi:hypothetical protein